LEGLEGRVQLEVLEGGVSLSF